MPSKAFFSGSAALAASWISGAADFSGGPDVKTPQSVEKVVGGKDAKRKAADEALGD